MIVAASEQREEGEQAERCSLDRAPPWSEAAAHYKVYNQSLERAGCAQKNTPAAKQAKDERPLLPGSTDPASK